MLKSIYTQTLARLAEIATLKWIDLDKGQLDGFDPDYRPDVAFPCALLDVQVANSRDESEGKRIQTCSGVLTIRLAFDFAGNTSAITPETTLASSLAFFDLEQAVYAKLQGWQGTGLQPMTRQSVRIERRADNYKVVMISFGVNWRENL